MVIFEFPQERKKTSEIIPDDMELKNIFEESCLTPSYRQMAKRLKESYEEILLNMITLHIDSELLRFKEEIKKIKEEK